MTITPLAQLYLKVFFVMGIPFATTMVILDIVSNEEFSLMAFCLYTIFFGGIMSALFVSYHAERLRGKTKSKLTHELLSVYQKRNIQTPMGPAELISRLASDPTFNNAHLAQTKDNIVITTPVSWESWGEVIKVSFRELTDARFDVHIYSKPRFSWTLLDSGRNKRNVDNMTKLLNNSTPVVTS